MRLSEGATLWPLRKVIKVRRGHPVSCRSRCDAQQANYCLAAGGVHYRSLLHGEVYYPAVTVRILNKFLAAGCHVVKEWSMSRIPRFMWRLNILCGVCWHAITRHTPSVSDHPPAGSRRCNLTLLHHGLHPQWPLQSGATWDTTSLLRLSKVTLTCFPILMCPYTAGNKEVQTSMFVWSNKDGRNLWLWHSTISFRLKITKW